MSVYVQRIIKHETKLVISVHSGLGLLAARYNISTKKSPKEPQKTSN